MITYDELKTLNGRIVEEALRDLGLTAPEREKLREIRRICESRIADNEALKGRLAKDRDYQGRCRAIDARSLPLKDILRVIKEGT